MKRLVSLVLALSMVLSMFTMAFAGTSLKDVAGTDYEAAVSALVELGIVNGYEDGTYQPDKVVSRAEMAKLLVISAGLEPAADVAKGATNFSDVPASHWATGYINVAAQYGYINGYPDGTFAPDATVTYAEAVTMAIRVLGYKTVVESVGTWPTNYIGKAQELKVLKDIKYTSYNNGATRGNVALLVWNMLRTNMWDVESENEINGLNYKKSGTMINKYFEDYNYLETFFDGFVIEDGKVYVSICIGYDEEQKELIFGKYEYDNNDFYTFVPGTDIEVLINLDDKKLLTIVSVDEDKFVEGTKADLDDEKYKNVPEADYIYAEISKKAVTSSTKINVNSKYVDEILLKDDYTKINGVKVKDVNGDAVDFENDAIIIKDDERINIKDVEVGDIFTTVTVNGSEVFYVVGSEEATGSLTKYVDNKIKVGSKEYTLDNNAMYVIDPEDEDEDAKEFENAGSDFAKMKNEEVKIILDTIVGKVVRIEFDGSIDDDDDEYDVKFYAATSEVENPASKVWQIDLENESDSDTYKFAKAAKAKTLWNEEVEGGFYAIMLNDDEEIEDIVAVILPSGDYNRDTTIPYGKESGEKYVVKYIASETYDEDEQELTSSKIGVNKNVVVVTILVDEDEEKTTVEFSRGLNDIEDLKNDPVVVIYDDDPTYKKAKYVVLFDEVSSRSDLKLAIVESGDCVDNGLGGKELELEDEEKELLVRNNDNTPYNDYRVLVYKTEDDDDDLYIEYIAGLTQYELSLSGDSNHGYVTDVDGKEVCINNVPYNFNAKSVKESLEDCTFVLVKVSEASDAEGIYEVDSINEVKYDNISLENNDRISGEPTDDVIFIIRGMAKR